MKTKKGHRILPIRISVIVGTTKYVKAVAYCPLLLLVQINNTM